MSALLCEYLGSAALGVLVTAVTHHCLMKLETQRNTNLDIAGYLYDIGHVKLTVAGCICKHLPVCIPNNGFLWQYCTHHDSDKEAAVVVHFCPSYNII